jgi:hypothetical protein
VTETPPQSQLPADLALVARASGAPTSPYRIEQPLRVKWLARRLAGQPGAEEAVREALALDTRMRDLADRARQTELDAPERAEVVLQLARLRVELDAIVSRVDGQPPPAPSALASLEPELRVRLADLLGVPFSPEYQTLLEMKAVEYIEQGRAFDQVAADFGFADCCSLAEIEPRGGLILTHNGSLLQVSAPGAGGDPRARRFVYQNIYGGKMPSEGTLELMKPVRVGHKVRTKHMETSPVRKLHLAVRPDDWHRQRETFRTLSDALVPKPARPLPPKTLWGALPNWHPTVVAKSVAVQRGEQQRKRLEQAAASARAELREHLLRLADPTNPPDDALLEADVLGLCMFLQRLRTEHGEPGYALRDVVSFVTDRGERCSFEHRGASSIALLERPARASVTIEDAGLLEQVLVRNAPVAIVDGAGGIAAVLGDVVWIQPRQSS